MPPKPKNKNPGRKPADDDTDDDQDEDEGDEAPLTRGDLQKMVASTVTGMLGRKLGPAIESAMKPILEKLTPPAKDDDADDDDDEDEGDDQPSRGKKGKPDPAYAKLLKQNERINKQLAEEKAQREKEKLAREGATIDNALTEHLTKLGVDPHRMRGALAVHRGFASIGEDGKVKYKVQREGYDEDVAPEVGLKEWGDTDEGKSYLAATGSTGGSGSRAPIIQGGKRPPAGSPEAKAQRHAEARQQLATGVAELLGGGQVAIE